MTIDSAKPIWTNDELLPIPGNRVSFVRHLVDDDDEPVVPGHTGTIESSGIVDGFIAVSVRLLTDRLVSVVFGDDVTCATDTSAD